MVSGLNVKVYLEGNPVYEIVNKRAREVCEVLGGLLEWVGSGSYELEGCGVEE